MSVTIKSEHELEKMREAGRILGIVHDEMAKIIRPGISTMDINRKGEEVIRSFGCIPSFLNYNGYPASICVSVNDEVVHGIPSKKRILQEGDIVSLDAGVIYEGYHSDAARTHAVGQISEEDQFLIDVTKQSFFEGIKYAKAGNHLYDISKAIAAGFITVSVDLYGEKHDNQTILSEIIFGTRSFFGAVDRNCYSGSDPYVGKA